MDIVINIEPIQQFFSQTPDKILSGILWGYAWLPFSIMFLWFAKEMWILYRQTLFAGAQKYVLLAIDIPKNNLQSMKSVENLFTYLAGAHGTINLIEKYWDGKFQLHFSLEIVSIEGYTQFLIRTPVPHRQLVESAIYSQYPDAEITEVNDYVENIPSRYPDETWDIHGGEFIPANHWAFPIKTWKEFEHQFGEPETTFRDPMAVLMDLCASLRKDEQLWFQFLVRPTDYEWVKEGDNVIRKILKEQVPSKKNILDYINDAILFIFSVFSGEAAAEKKEPDPLKMMNLKPKEKKQVEFIQRKLSHLGFEYKMRLVYAAKKEVMNKPKVFGGFVGYMKQFMDLDLNNLKPDMKVTVTSTKYFFKKSRLIGRQNRLINNYKSRTMWGGRLPKMMDIEELATIWHFPIESVVRAPLIQKSPGRKAEPPMGLPIGEELISAETKEPVFEREVLGIETGVSHAASVQVSPLSKVVQFSEDTREIFGLEEPEEITSEEDIREREKSEEVKELFNVMAAPKKAVQPKKEAAPVIQKGAPPANLPIG